MADLNFLPKNLRKSLLKFQKDGIRFGITQRGRCLIGDEMGLGKTLQGICIAYRYKVEWPLLIIVPSSMKYPWVDELEKWLPELQPRDINLVKSGSDIGAFKTAKVSIVSYGLISRQRGQGQSAFVNALESTGFGVAIVDESHCVKNIQTSRTKIIMKVLQRIRRVILLTGTPSLARPEELYSQIKIIRPNLFRDFRSFGEKYCDGRVILQPTGPGRVIQKFDTRLWFDNSPNKPTAARAD